MIYYDLTYIDNEGNEQTISLEYQAELLEPEQFVVDLTEQLGYKPAITVVQTRGIGD